MHGLLLLHLKPYIGQKLSEDEAWTLLFQRSGVDFTVFTPLEHYAQMDAVRLFYSAAELRGENIASFLRGYGRYLIPKLMKVYQHSFHFNGDGNVFRLLEQLDGFYARHRGTGSMNPPGIFFQKESPRKATFRIRSDFSAVLPEICQLSHGMLEGLAIFFQQQVGVKHVTCVVKNAPFCTFELRPRIQSSSALPRAMRTMNGKKSV